MRVVYTGGEGEITEKKSHFIATVKPVQSEEEAVAFINESKDSVEQFMQLLKSNDEKAEKKWEEYLTYLAILISNLRMAYDMDIILGGEMGGYLSDYMIPLGEKVMRYNGFDHDLRYLKNCSYKKEASAVGAAKHFLQDFIGKI